MFFLFLFIDDKKLILKTNSQFLTDCKSTIKKTLSEDKVFVYNI